MNESEGVIRDFIFKFPSCTSDELEFKLEVPVNIPYDGSTKEFTQRIIAKLQIPVYLEKDLDAALAKFVAEETQNYHNDRDEALIHDSKNGKIDIDELVKKWEKTYAEQTVEYAKQKGATDEEVFAAAYHRLVHSPALETMLQVENSYATTIQSIIKQRDDDISNLTNNQTDEMEEKVRMLHTFTTETDINDLASKHFEEQSMIAGKWGSQLDALCQTQKVEYRAWLMKTLEEQQTSSTLNTPSNSPLTLFPGIESMNIGSSAHSAHERLLEESFTIHLGSQLKQMHNVRIMSANIHRFCAVTQPCSVSDSSRRLQAALGLYSTDLCGLVLLAENTPSKLIGLAAQLAKVCKQSTEYHFLSIDDQLQKITEDTKIPVFTRNTERQKEISDGNHADSLLKKVKDPKNLQTGDIYITKHSNLVEIHVIFHLVVDDSALRSGDINSRHPAILGLRNILKTACSNDVTTLTLPVLLRHDMSEEMTVAWCVKRAELVLKCVKGFMIEMASWGGSELKNIQFLVPEGISEEVFSALASMLPSIFRVSNPLKFKANHNKYD